MVANCGKSERSPRELRKEIRYVKILKIQKNLTCFYPGVYLQVLHPQGGLLYQPGAVNKGMDH
jgi:hypothetical protein